MFGYRETSLHYSGYWTRDVMATVTNVCFLLAIIVSHVTAKCLFLQRCSKERLVSLTPMNPKVYMTETITLNCNNEHGDSKDLVFYINDDEVPADKVRAQDGHIASLTITNASRALNHALLRCTNRNNAKPGCDDCRLLNVYEPPAPVINASCVVHDWTSNMNCSWELGRQYLRPPNVSLKWRISGSTCAWTPCPNQNLNYCFWGSTVDGDFSMKSIDMVVTVRSGDRQVASYYKINTGTVVKPDSVSNLQSYPVDSRCIAVTWSPSARREYKTIYRVTYISKWNTSQGIKYIEGTDSNKYENKSVILCNLIPYTTYQVSVDCKPAEDVLYGNGSGTGCYYGNCIGPEEKEFTCLTGTGYWSDRRATTTATYGDVPSMAPAMTEGGYIWISLEQGYRQVYVYWKALDDMHKNGPLKGYDVNITSSAGSGTKTTRHYLANYVTFDSAVLRGDAAYNVTVRARNVNGTSAGSTILIPPLQQVLSPPEIIVTMSNQTDSQEQREVEVTWYDFPRTTKVTGFTLYTCKNDGGNCAFKASVDWRYIPRENLSTVFRMTSPGQHLYGLSVETRRGSSGFHWQTCVYTDVAELSEAPGNLQVHAVTGDSSLFISWDLLQCDSGKPYIDLYRLEYCKVDGSRPSCQEISSKKNSVVLNHLEEDQLYSVRVQGVTQSGSPGPWSGHIGKTTNKLSDSRKAKLAGIIAGILSGVIVLLCTTGLCYKKVKPWFKTPAIGDILKESQVPEKQGISKSRAPSSIEEEPNVDGNPVQRSLSVNITTDQQSCSGTGQNQNQSDIVEWENISLQTLSVNPAADQNNFSGTDQNHNQSDTSNKDSIPIKISSKEAAADNSHFSDTDQNQNQFDAVSENYIPVQNFLAERSNEQNRFSGTDENRNVSDVANTGNLRVQTLSEETVADQNNCFGTENQSNKENIRTGYVRVTTTGDGGYVMHGTAGGGGYVMHGTAGDGGYVMHGTAGDDRYVIHGTAGDGGYVMHGTAGDDGYVIHGTAGDDGYVIHGTAGDGGYVMHGMLH